MFGVCCAMAVDEMKIANNTARLTFMVLSSLMAASLIKKDHKEAAEGYDDRRWIGRLFDY
jgi:hypothetical protein